LEWVGHIRVRGCAARRAMSGQVNVVIRVIAAYGMWLRE
jgi:hypothetical protein